MSDRCVWLVWLVAVLCAAVGCGRTEPAGSVSDIRFLGGVGGLGEEGWTLDDANAYHSTWLVIERTL